MLWYKYYILLAIALDLDERDRYWEYLLAGGKEKDWKWRSKDHAGMRRDPQRAMWSKVLGGIKKGRGGDIAHVMQPGARRIVRKEKQLPNGQKIVVFEDGEGNDITSEVERMMRHQGYIFKRTKV